MLRSFFALLAASLVVPLVACVAATPSVQANARVPPSPIASSTPTATSNAVASALPAASIACTASPADDMVWSAFLAKASSSAAPTSTSAPSAAPPSAPLRACGAGEVRVPIPGVCVTTVADDPTLVQVESEGGCLSAYENVPSEACRVVATGDHEITVDASLCLVPAHRPMPLDCQVHEPPCNALHLAPGTYTFIHDGRRLDVSFPAPAGLRWCL